MENLFELIVFFITAVIFIVSAITKQKKKPNEQSSGMDNLVESFFGLVEESNVSQRNERQEVAYENKEEIVQRQKEEKKITYERASEHAEKEKKDIESDVESQAVDFDLRKAVIYSEILNRKHF